MASVLDTALLIHPELENMISIIISSVATKEDLKLADENATDSKKSSLNIDKIDFGDLSDFLNKYAPLQILADRKKGNIKFSLSTRMLDILGHLHTAHALVALVDEKSSTSCPITSDGDQKLKSLVSVNTLVSLPHPLWNSNHDVTLIRAIVKHGWIGREENCRAINEDKSISWGPPFEENNGEKETVSLTKSTTNEIEGHKKVIMENMKIVAFRVASFLNSNQSIVREIKSFDINLIIQSYGIVECDSIDDTDESPIAWVVDDCLLQKCFKESRKDGKPLAELPTKKDLLKRARYIAA